jgi:hypothetical protein
MNELHGKVADSLQGFGGHLECTVCNATQPLGSVSTKLASGWPKCHGYTMTWITARMEQS